MHARPSPERPVSAQGGRGFVSQNDKFTICRAWKFSNPLGTISRTSAYHSPFGDGGPGWT